jgi:hypothetical protein
VTAVTYNYNSNVTDTSSSSDQGSDVFSISFRDQVERPNDEDVWMMIELDIFFTDLQPGNTTYTAEGQISEMNCDGPKTTRTCLLRPALIEYPMIITTQGADSTGKNVVAEIDSTSNPWNFHPIMYQNLTQVGNIVDGHSGAVTLNGLTLALNNVFGSLFTMGPASTSTPAPSKRERRGLFVY